MLTRGNCPECGDAFIDLTGGDGHFFNRCQDCGNFWELFKCRFCLNEIEAEDKYDCPHCDNPRRAYK